jgi:invasion protein IalB
MMFRLGKLAWCLVGASLLAHSPTIAQQAAAPENPFLRGSRQLPDVNMGEWRKLCFTTPEAKQLCRTMRSATLKTGQEFLRIDLVVQEGLPGTRMEIKVPPGLFLPAGIRVNVDKGSEMKIPYLACMANLCEASDVASVEFLNALEAGTVLSIEAVDLNLLTVAVSVPLAGLTKTLSGPPAESFDAGLQRRK